MLIERSEFIAGHVTYSESTAVREKQTLKPLIKIQWCPNRIENHLSITSSFHDKSLGSRCITYEVADSSFVRARLWLYDLGCTPSYDRENQPSKTVTGLFISLFCCHWGRFFFFKFHGDVSFDPQYNAKLWFTFVTFSELKNSLASA
jgi:hypothetical protein